MVVINPVNALAVDKVNINHNSIKTSVRPVVEDVSVITRTAQDKSVMVRLRPDGLLALSLLVENQLLRRMMVETHDLLINALRLLVNSQDEAIHLRDNRFRPLLVDPVSRSPVVQTALSRSCRGVRWKTRWRAPSPHPNPNSRGARPPWGGGRRRLYRLSVFR